MSDLLQLGQHPDADQLNAFVEQALPAQERKETLAHLADCSECREIVALSLPPVEEFPAVDPGRVGKVESGGWLSGWRLAWIAAPALAALMVVTLYLRSTASDRSRAAKPGQVAELQRPSTPNIPQVSGPPVKGGPEKGMPPAGDLSRARKPGTTRSEASTESLPRNGRGVAARDLAQPVGVTGSANGMGVGMAGGVAGGRTVAGPQAVAGAAPSPPQALPSLSLAAPTTASSDSAVPSAATNSSTRIADKAPPAAAALPTPANVLAGRSALASSGLGPALAPLPSGQAILSLAVKPLAVKPLAAKSFAAKVHKLVVLDTKGAVFYSEDDGRHWREVAPAWRGRAVAVTSVLPNASLALHSNSFAPGAPERFTAGAMASAQTYAAPDASASSLSGTITDAAGAAIPGAVVIVQESRYGPVRVGKTDALGHYVFTNLAPGSYRLDASAPGFEKQSVVENVAASQQALRDVILPVGTASQTVTVEAGNGRLETASRTTADEAAKAKHAGRAPLDKQRDAVFVITTETGERWSSSDGLTWKETR